MVFPFLNPPPAIGCGDPGDPIDFGVLFTGSASLSGLVEAANTKQAVFDYKFKDCSAGGMSRLHISTTLGNNGNYFYVGQEADDLYSIYHGTIASTLFYVKSVGKLRDKAAHYEPHVRIDTTQAVASDRIQLWLGGVRMILTGTFPAQNADMFLLGGSQYHYIGSWFGSPNTPGGGGDVILSRVIYEHSVTPQLSDFGYFNAYGQWMNKTYSGPAVYHLAFKNGLDLGADETGVHDFTPNGLTFDSQVPDTPSHSFNTNDPNNTQSTVTLSNGNLTGTYSGTANVGASVGTMPIRSGRFYWEVKIDNLGGHENDIGVIPWRSVMIAGNPYSYTSGIVGSGEVVYCKDGGISRNGTYTAGYGASFATGDVIGVLVDCEQDTINFSKNGVWQGEIALCAKPFLTTNTNYSGSVMTSNFGQRAFVHPIPAGAKTLNTANLPCPEILNPDDYFTIRLVGDNTPLPWDALTGKTLAVTKDRNATTSFRVNDTLRGNGKAWACNEGGAEINEGAAGVTWTANGPVYGSAAEYQGNRITWFWRASPKAGFDLIEADHVTGTPTTVTHQAGGLIDYAWLVPLDGGDVPGVSPCPSVRAILAPKRRIGRGARMLIGSLLQRSI